MDCTLCEPTVGCNSRTVGVSTIGRTPTHLENEFLDSCNDVIADERLTDEAATVARDLRDWFCLLNGLTVVR